MLLCSSVDAATIRGQVSVWKKGGEEPASHSKHAVVYVTGITTPPPEEPVESQQVDKQFRKRLLAVTKGQKIHFWNQDHVRHNVFSNDARHTFDLETYPKGSYREVVYNEEGRYKVYCNIHPRMVCDVVVLPNSYYALTQEDGSFEITGVPPGSYTLNAWHIYGGEEQQPLELSESGADVTFRLVSTQVVRDVVNHRDKHGRRFRRQGY
jgi:plastocyanin